MHYNHLLNNNRMPWTDTRNFHCSTSVVFKRFGHIEFELCGLLCLCHKYADVFSLFFKCFWTLPWEVISLVSCHLTVLPYAVNCLILEFHQAWLCELEWNGIVTIKWLLFLLIAVFILVFLPHKAKRWRIIILLIILIFIPLACLSISIYLMGSLWVRDCNSFISTLSEL